MPSTENDLRLRLKKKNDAWRVENGTDAVPEEVSNRHFQEVSAELQEFAFLERTVDKRWAVKRREFPEFEGQLLVLEVFDGQGTAKDFRDLVNSRLFPDGHPRNMKEALERFPAVLEQARSTHAQPASELTELFTDLETETLKDVPIFSAGTWTPGNGGPKKWTRADMDEIVANFVKLQNKLKPFFKMRHLAKKDEDKITAGAALGWIHNLRRSGDQLIADITDVPSKLAAMIRAKRFKRVSSEIFLSWTDEASGTKYKNVLSAVGLLGAQHPAVTTLNDIAALHEEGWEACFSAPGAELEIAMYSTNSQANEGEKMNTCPVQFGDSLARRLNSLINGRVSGSVTRGSVLSQVAKAGGIEENTLNQILSGSINCPPLSRLQGFARALNVGAQSLISAAESDGCSYNTSKNTQSQQGREEMPREIKEVLDALGLEENGDPVAAIQKLTQAGKTVEDTLATERQERFDSEINTIFTGAKEAGKLLPANEIEMRDRVNFWASQAGTDGLVSFSDERGNDRRDSVANKLKSYFASADVVVKFNESGGNNDQAQEVRYQIPDDILMLVRTDNSILGIHLDSVQRCAAITKHAREHDVNYVEAECQLTGREKISEPNSESYSINANNGELVRG